jgi:hypothetical protein
VSEKGVSNVWINIILFIKHHLSFFWERENVLQILYNIQLNFSCVLDIWYFFSAVLSLLQLHNAKAKKHDKVEIEWIDANTIIFISRQKKLFSLRWWGECDNGMTFNYIISEQFCKQNEISFIAIAAHFDAEIWQPLRRLIASCLHGIFCIRKIL